jgi:hypothetical protein
MSSIYNILYSSGSDKSKIKERKVMGRLEADRPVVVVVVVVAAANMQDR